MVEIATFQMQDPFLLPAARDITMGPSINLHLEEIPTSPSSPPRLLVFLLNFDE